MFRLHLIVIILFFLNNNAKTQFISSKRLAIVDTMLATNAKSIVCTFDKPILLEAKHLNNSYINCVIKSGEQIFFTVIGTGTVLALKARSEVQEYYEKYDSSSLYGNNFGSQEFIYNDTLFSFGGYGYWHFNGQLRYLSGSRDWQLIDLNQEAPLTSHFLVQSENSIYYIQLPYKIEGTNSKILTKKAFQIDLKTRQLVELGELNSTIDLPKSVINIPLKEYNGILIEHLAELYLLDFKKNRIRKLLNSELKNWITSATIDPADAYFTSNGILYSYSMKSNQIRSIKISDLDFSNTGESLYHSNSKQSFKWTLLSLGVLLALFPLLYFSKRKKAASTTKVHQEATETLVTIDEKEPETENGDEPKSENRSLFSEIEKSVINTLKEKSKNNSKASVDDINKVIGVAKKSLEIQKKYRREIINSINLKFIEAENVNYQLIQSTRTEEDKRYYNYSLNPLFIEQYEKYTQYFE